MKLRPNMFNTIAGTLFFLGFAIAANAQTAEQTVWASTKGVQKFSNKQLFEDNTIKGSHIHAIVLNPTWNVSKGVANVNRTADIGQANIVGGSSDWQISKGVQQIQRKKTTAENRD